LGDLAAVAADPRTPRLFDEFCENETELGGPDPHMATIAEMSLGVTLPEMIWRAGCYIGVYNAPTSERLWQEYPWPRALEEPETVEPWLRTVWAGIETRRERRSVRRAEQLARFLTEYAAFAASVSGRPWADGTLVGQAAYDAAWVDVQTVYSLGRYVAIKILEVYARYAGLPDLRAYDIRPLGGWSPRQGLVMLYPHHRAALMGDDSPTHLKLANYLAAKVKDRLAGVGVATSWYNVQVLLCDAKQALVGERQFPGRSLDSEIAYADSIAPFWGDRPTELWRARAALFPARALGEVAGWRRVRKELGIVARAYSYTWTDLTFNFPATTDLAHPVAWA